jgi:hypothetical protein
MAPVDLGLPPGAHLGLGRRSTGMGGRGDGGGGVMKVASAVPYNFLRLHKCSILYILLQLSYIREYRIIHRGSGFLAIVWFGSSPTPFPLSHEQVVSLSDFQCVADSPVELTDGRGWARSQIIRPLDSLALYKSFRTLCTVVTCRRLNTTLNYIFTTCILL